MATRLMKTKLNSWPEGTGDYVNHRILKEYIQETSKKAGVDDLAIYGAKVTEVKKVNEKWDLRYETLKREGGEVKVEEKIEVGFLEYFWWV